MLGKLNELL
jgi:CheY-like chemotaxis protein